MKGFKRKRGQNRNHSAAHTKRASATPGGHSLPAKPKSSAPSSPLVTASNEPRIYSSSGPSAHSTQNTGLKHNKKKRKTQHGDAAAGGVLNPAGVQIQKSSRATTTLNIQATASKSTAVSDVQVAATAVVTANSTKPAPTPPPAAKGASAAPGKRRGKKSAAFKSAAVNTVNAPPGAAAGASAGAGAGAAAGAGAGAGTIAGAGAGTTAGAGAGTTASAGAAVKVKAQLQVAPGSNWQALKASLEVEKTQKAALPRKKFHAKRKKPKQEQAQGAAPGSVGATATLTPVVSLDCEMVGVGEGGERSQLARVCLVNNDGNVLLDTFVRGRERVTDYRTRFSGVRARDLAQAPLFGQVQEQVSKLLKGRILVGHALHNDLKVLDIDHPQEMLRDTSRYPALMKRTAVGRKPQPRSLKSLSEEFLGLSIQAGEHSPVDDARCSLYLYHKFRKQWEAALRRPGGMAQLEPKAKKKVKLVPAGPQD